MNKISQIIILGSGYSLNSTPKQALQAVLDTNCSIVCNYGFKHFNGTFLAFLDRDFYKSRDLTKNPDIYDELKALPLIVGVNHNGVEEFKLDNTILLNKKKIHCGNLTGIFALSLAVKILDHSGTVFLCGFDWPRRNPDTVDRTKYSPNSNLDIHYYGKEIKHYGVGYLGYYENHNPNKCFEIFQKERDVKVYNVSLESNINCFEKISYEKMYELLDKNICYKQNELRKYISTLFSNS